MIRLGVCMIPFPAASWLQPQPTIASWLALRKLGVTDVRLQFDVSIVSPKPGEWNTSLFRSFFAPARNADMRINGNYVTGTEPVHHDAAFHEQAARRMEEEFGIGFDSRSFGNEPGPLAQAYEAEHPGGDYMREVYFPRYVTPFTKGVRRARPNAWIGGCDADSFEIQERYLHLANNADFAPVKDFVGRPCDEGWVHPYGDVGGGDYATLKRFVESHQSFGIGRGRPWGISEVDHQQFLSARLRERDVTAEWIAQRMSPHDAAEQGALARIRATDDEIGALIDYFNSVATNYPDCTRFVLGQADYFFERGKRPDNGLPCNSFFLPEPVVSVPGQRFADAIAKVNGPVPTQPKVRHRAGGKP